MADPPNAEVAALGMPQGHPGIIHRHAPGIMYTKESLDVTKLIIEKFNKKG